MRSLILATILVALATPVLAGPYADMLKSDVVKLMSRADPAIPDDTEDAYWSCWAEAFAHEAVDRGDRAALDAAVVSRDEDNGILVRYRVKLEEALMKPAGKVNGWVSERMRTTCPDAVAGVTE